MLRGSSKVGLFIAVVWSNVAHAAVVGPGTDKQIEAQRADQPPRLDGALDDEVWKQAKTDDAFTQVFPDDGAKPSTRTSIQVAYDDKNLYVGINAYDPEPGKISARLARRDSLIDSDYVEVFLDTRHDHDNGYWFRVNAAGVVADGQMHDDTRTNFDWDAVWTGKAQIHGSGWSAELQIPLSVLRFSESDSKTWGFDVRRGTRRTGEIVRWSPIPRTASGTLSRLGHITNLEEVKPRRAMEARPFSVIRLNTSLPEGGSFAFGDAQSTADVSFGANVKLGLTDGLTLDATVNPDFGQVDADPVVLNLSSFEVYVDERRPFFLEGAGLFRTDVLLIHTRRIGQSVSRLRAGALLTLRDGSQSEIVRAPLFAPIYAAFRVSGSVGDRFSVNALSAITGPETVVLDAGRSESELDVVPARNFSIARGKYSLGGSSYLGFASTAVTRLGSGIIPAQNHDAFAESIDGRWVRADGMYRAYFQLATAHRSGGDSVEASGRPFTREDGTVQGPGDLGAAGEFGGSKAGGAMKLYGRYRFVSPKFDVDAMGFEDDWDYHQFLTDTTYHHEKRFGWFQRAQIGAATLTEFNFDGTRKTLRLTGAASALTKQFWSVETNFRYHPPGSWTTRETSDGAKFELSDLVVLGGSFSSDSRRDVSGGASVSLSKSPSTDLESLSGGVHLSLRPYSPFEVTLRANLGKQRGNMRVVDCSTDEGTCWRGSELRDYTFALQDTSSLDLTMRASLALSTVLSIDSYVQLFAAGGSYHDYSSIYGAEGATPKLGRDDAESIPFAGDYDQDGDRDDRFSFATLNANVVMRWEMFPGTTLMAVYTRSQRHNRQLHKLDYGGLRRGEAEEIVLLKLTLFASR